MASIKERSKIRKNRIRNAIRACNKSGRVRLSVFRSKRHIYAQLIDDLKGHTLGTISTLSKDLAATLGQKTLTVEAAKLVGEKIGCIAKDLKIGQVVFDKGPYKYHGRVKALADAAREHVEF